MKRRFPQNAVNGFRTEIILVIEAMYGIENLVSRQARILNVSELGATLVQHLRVLHHKTVAYRVIVKLGAGISVRHRDLDSFYVQLFCECNRVVDGLASLSRQSENEITVDD